MGNEKEEKVNQIDLNVLNFERYKWGGVRHQVIEYLLFDLKEFLKLPLKDFTSEDVEILKSIISCVNELEENNKAGAYRQLITSKKLLPSNKAELEKLLGTMGMCGIFETQKQRGFLYEYTDFYQTVSPEETNDWDYPINWWTAKNGVNYNAVEEVFGTWLR